MAEERVQRRLAAILAADVVGYSRLMGADEEGTRARFNAHLQELIEPSIANRRGRIVKTTGDGLLVEFASAVDAVQCAVDIQEGMSDRNANEADDRRMAFRIGVNLGDVIIEGDDIHGDGVNVAARLEGLAEPGRVVVSGKVHDEVRGKLDVAFADLGSRELKNVVEPVRAFTIANTPMETSGAPLPLPDKPSIAVLPFDNMSGDPEQEYFADGMVEEIITGLSRIRSLTVIARNSSFTFKGVSTDIREIAGKLGVRYVLEGSVRKAGARVRITAQLIEAETGGHLWADRFDGTLADVFDLQDRITAGVVAAIEPSVRQAEIERAKRKRPGNLDAYDLYLRALERAYMFTPAGREAALKLLDAALAHDPGYANAHAVAALCHQQRFLWEGRASEAKAAALRHSEAVAASRTDDGASLALAAFVMSALGNNHETGLAMIDRALIQSPNSADAYRISALINSRLGRYETSTAHAERALRLSPFDPLRYATKNVRAIAELAAGNHEDALAGFRRALADNPDFVPARIFEAVCLARLGRHDGAQASVRRVLEVSPDTRASTLNESLITANAELIENILPDLREAGLPE